MTQTRGIRPDEDAFAGVATRDTVLGIPALSDALAYLECRVIQTCTFGGDHDLVIAQVTGGDLLNDGPPFTHVRGSGFHY